MFTIRIFGQLPNWESIPPRVLAGLMIVQVLYGLANCFFGYRIFKVVLGVTGFAVGALFGGLAGAAISSNNNLVVLAAGLGAGVVGAALFVVLYYIGVFVIGASFAALLVVGIGLLANVQPLPPLALLVAAAIGGIVALVLQKPVIILSTAFSGAWSVVTGIAWLFGKPVPGLEPLLPQGQEVNVQHVIALLLSRMTLSMLVCWLVLGTVGVIVQYMTTRRPRPVPATVAPGPEPQAAGAPGVQQDEP